MRNLTRYSSNPLITPDGGHLWEVGGTFNPGAVAADGVIHLLYRAVDGLGTSRLGYACSLDGGNISNRSPAPILEPSAEWEEFGCEDPRITQLGDRFYVTYTAYSHRGPRIALASTRDFLHFKKHGVIGPDLNDKDCVIFPKLINDKIALLHRVDGKIQVAYFEDLDTLEHAGRYWGDYLKNLENFEVIKPQFYWEARKVGAGPPPIKTSEGWLVIYHGVSSERVYRVGALLLDLDDPQKVICRTKKPILQPQTDFEKSGVVPNVVFPSGAVVHQGELIVYYGGADRVCCAASVPLDEFLRDFERKALKSNFKRRARKTRSRSPRRVEMIT